ncbi:unnamed protein product [Trichobilharzia szidati]|nr:unnamed protein product [Trichobilharzia szidati]
MSSIISYNPVVNDHTTINMFKSPNETNPGYTNNNNNNNSSSMYNIDLLQWQLNTSDNSVNHQFKSYHHKHKKDHIRENIRRLRELEEHMAVKRCMEQSSASNAATDRTQNSHKCTKITTSSSSCHNHLPPVSMKKSTHETKINPPKQSSIEQDNQNDSFKQIHRCLSDDTDESQNTIQSSSVAENVQNQTVKSTETQYDFSTSDNQLTSIPSKYSSTHTQIDTPINRLTQTIPIHTINSEYQHSLTKRPGQYYQRPPVLPVSNRSDKRYRTIATSTTTQPHPANRTVSRGDYLRAHTRDVEDDVDLKILSNIPITPIHKQVNSVKTSVPKAESAKNVEFIRRDINFVRANAHLASVPSLKGTPGIRRISSLNSLSTSSSSILNDKVVYPQHSSSVNDTKMSKSVTSHTTTTTKMWPERRLKVGVVPQYIIKMRQQEEERIQNELKNQPDPDQPPGHQRMPEQERLDTLEMLKKAHQQLLEEFSHLPIRMDTLRIRSRRAEIETRLSELEQAIEIFNKPKVFIKPD